MSTSVTSRETNRLHRWAMWRMTVNEGIISCIKDQGTTRVLYPDSSSDSANSVASDGLDFTQFPFITPEQMSVARKLNIREKYGSSHGLSDDAYFIFGLPRISVGKDVPEVTSTGTRSVYESFSELGDANTTLPPRGTGPVENNTMPVTYSELGPTPDSQSVGSQDGEVQRINGCREEGWRNQQRAVSPRIHLYSIREERNNNLGEADNRYSSDRYRPAEREMSANRETDPYSSQHYRETDPTNRYSIYPAERKTSHLSTTSYADNETANRYLTNRYPAEETNMSGPYSDADVIDRYASSHYRERETSDVFATADRNQNEHMFGRYHHDQRTSFPNRNHEELRPISSVKEAIDRYEAVNRNATSPPTSPDYYYSRQTSSRSSNRNLGSLPPPQSPTTKHDVYPPFSFARQSSHSPTRRSFSPLPSSPRQNNFPYNRQSLSYAPVQPGKSGFPSGREDSGVRSPGYGNGARPTRLMSDGEAERVKRQAYYDWTTPVTERSMIMDFNAMTRYS